jgi:hypothetical protein
LKERDLKGLAQGCDLLDEARKAQLELAEELLKAAHRVTVLAGERLGLEKLRGVAKRPIEE